MVLSTACINLNLMQVCLPRNPYFFFHPFGFIFDKFQKKVINSCLENTPSLQSWPHERLLIKLVCSGWVSWRNNHCEPKGSKNACNIEGVNTQKPWNHRAPPMSSSLSLFSFLPSFQCSLAFGEEFGVCDFTMMEHFPECILCMYYLEEKLWPT